jgi:hypothetical protein
MPDTIEISELTEENFKRARDFARYLLLHVGPLIDQMQLTRNEAELAFTCLLADSLAQRPEGIRRALARQWQQLIMSGAENFETERSAQNPPEIYSA